MPIPVFEQQAPAHITEHTQAKKEKISPWSIFFSILLTIILITMGEYAWHDVNKVFNPQYESCHVQVTFNSMLFFQKVNQPQPDCDLRSYAGFQLLVHADLTAPLLLIGILFLMLTRKKKLAAHVRAIFSACSIFLVWMSVRLIYETESFLVKHYPLTGKYVVFLTIASICIALIIIIQNKLKRKTAAA